MGDRSSYAEGTPNWVDLSTSDLEGAKRFYGGLFGWEFHDEPIPGGSGYSQGRIEGKAVAGLYQGDGSHPTVWNNYIAVDGADAAADRARELGGTVVMDPFDVMDVGRMVLVQDPTGAFIAFWEAREHIGANYVNAPGALSWNELVTTDLEKAREFYGGMFGYDFDQLDIEGDKHLIPSLGGRSVAGMMSAPPGAPAMSYWLAYFGTDDLDRAATKAQELGARVMVPPTRINAELGSFAVVADPQGGTFAMYAGTFQD
jgi:predicted enzyme related to lactoylglutathione lyase